MVWVLEGSSLHSADSLPGMFKVSKISSLMNVPWLQSSNKQYTVCLTLGCSLAQSWTGTTHILVILFLREVWWTAVSLPLCRVIGCAPLHTQYLRGSKQLFPLWVASKFFNPSQRHLWDIDGRDRGGVRDPPPGDLRIGMSLGLPLWTISRPSW